MKLEVGMYVRNKFGQISKITKTDLLFESTKEYCKKASHNIIDLIEVGDYVNGSRVVYFMIDEEKSINEGIDEKIGVVVEEEWEGKKYLTKDIKSIVTKEQFNSIKYEVEE